jgi:hypothetical protein
VISEFLTITDAAMADALAYMQVNSVTYEGVTVDGVCSEKTSDLLSIGGYEQHFTGSTKVRKDGFPQPVKGGKIIINGSERRITSWDENPIFYRIYLEDITR